MAIDLHRELIEQAGPIPPFCVEPRATISQVLQDLKQRARGEALVCRDGVLVGIFTERDAMRVLATGVDLSAPIASVMTTDLVTLHSGDTMGKAVRLMSTRGHRRLPLVDERGRPTGVVHAAGIVQWLVQHFPTAVYNLAPVSPPSTREREGP